MLPETFEEKLEREFDNGLKDAEEGKKKYTSFSYPAHLEPRAGVVSKFKESYDEGYECGKRLHVNKRKHLKIRTEVLMLK
jgi:hypothetical protein